MMTQTPLTDPGTYKVYLANAMTGMPDYNYNWFEKTQKLLQRKGLVVLSPHNLDIQDHLVDIVAHTEGDDDHGYFRVFDSVTLKPDFDYESVLKKDFSEIKTCNGIVLGPQWMASDGAKREFRYAYTMGLDIYEWHEGTRTPVLLSDADSWELFNQVLVEV